MEITNYTIGNTTGTNSNSESQSKVSMDDFLKIMAAEIKNQSPLGGEGSSGSNTDYISQLAQFTTLDQLSSITENLSLLTLMSQQQYSFSLIGKEVTVSDEDGTQVTGIVDSIQFEKGYAVLKVNDKNYYLGAIVSVSNPEGQE